jgi:hypothetical protein
VKLPIVAVWYASTPATTSSYPWKRNAYGPVNSPSYGVVAYSTSRTKGTDAVAGVVALSVTVAVKLLAPGAVGVPEITPLDFSVIPGGSAPAVSE